MQILTRAAHRRVYAIMNDTVLGMRPCGLLLLVLAGTSAGCGDGPSFNLTVDHPKGYAVTQTVVTVYVGDNVTCDEIKYGDRTDAELAAITSDEVDVSGGGRIELDRLGNKAVVARGYDIQHRLVTAGCEDVPALSGSTHVALHTQATAVVAINPGQPDQPFDQRPILITMTDVAGAALDGMVSWQLTGPAGAPEQPPAAGQMTASGQTTIKIADLGTPGPEGLRIRAPWATEPLPLVTAFDLSHATTLAFDGTITAGIHPSCDVRDHAGKAPTLVCLTAATGVNNHRNAIELAWQGSQYTATPLPALPDADGSAFAIFVDHDGSADEPVYVITQDATGKTGHWIAVAPAGTDRSITFDNNLQSVIYAARCPGSATALVGVTTSPPIAVGTSVLETYTFFTPGGIVVSASTSGEALSGGCIDGVDGQTRQAVVTTTAAGDPVLSVFGADKSRVPVQDTKLNGSGFIAVSAGGASEQRFAGTRLQATGTVVFEAVLAPTTTADNTPSFKIVERTELDAAAPPLRILSGKLDADADTDLIWDMAAGARKRDFQISLAKQLQGAPLTAITSGPPASASTNAIDVAIGDFDGNGIDEIALFTAGNVTFYQP
jgi:hypothetical protein